MAWNPNNIQPDQIDYGEAEHFLEALVGPQWRDLPLVFQTFDDNSDRRRKAEQTARLLGKRGRRADPYARVHLGTWDQCKDVLTTYNKNGAGVFITINHTEGGRRIEHLKSIRAIWNEWDWPEPPPQWPLVPHILVESSPGKFHVYWLCHDVSANDHHRLMVVMVGQWGSDPNATDAVRPLRLPGFFHQKVNSAKGLTGTPWRVRVISTEQLPAYGLPELLAAFGVEQYEDDHKAHDTPPRPPGSGGRSSIPINFRQVRGALAKIPCDDRDVWLRVGLSLSSTRHVSAFTLWDEWSHNSAKYDYDDQCRVWESFREQKGGAGTISLGTLYKIAQDHGWKQEDDNWTNSLVLNARGTPIACPPNIALILRFSPVWSAGLRFNTFSGRAEYGEPAQDEYGRSYGAPPWSDLDDGHLGEFLRDEYKMAVTHLGHCTQAVDNVAQDQSYDPITNWLDHLPDWDQEPRLDHFFADFCNAVQTPYTAFCGRSLFLSLVCRAYEPGRQVDTVIVLEGPEGAKKTSLCRLLGGPWYKPISMSFETKDLFISLRHAWLAELAELDAFNRSGQARIKSLLTTLKDDYRPPYGRHEIEQPRRTIFVGTTNDPAYIVDPYGGRRFLPVKVKDIQLHAIQPVLCQLFAEARDRYKAGELWWTEEPAIAEEAAEVRELVREEDPWEDVIRQYVHSHPGTIYMRDIFSNLCLDIPEKDRERSQQTKIGRILKRLGYVKIRRRLPKNSPKEPEKYESFYLQEES